MKSNSVSGGRRVSRRIAAALAALLIGSAVPGAPGKEAAAFSEKKKLHELLTLRKQKFERYAASLDEKSGLFGSRTKNDIRQSMDVLRDIIETDNQIIGVLNRAVDFKVFEKSKLNYDLLERDQARERLEKQTAAMQARLASLESELAGRKRTARWLWVAVVLLLAAAGFPYLKKPRRG
jgi:hypothetical protein